MAQKSLRSIGLNLYFFATVLLFAWVWYAHYVPLTVGVWRDTFILTALCIVFNNYAITLPSGDELSLTSAFLFTQAVSMGVTSVAVSVVIMTIPNLIKNPFKWKLGVFNTVQFGISAFVGLWAYELFGGTVAEKISFVHPYKYLAFMIAYFITNVALIIGYMLIRESLPMRSVIQGFFDKEVLLSYFMMMGFGVLTIVLLQFTGVAGVLFFSLILSVLAAIFRHYFTIYSHFKSLAVRDEITGTFNHREFQTKISELVAQSRPFSLFLLDVDFFKVYNDTLGHPQGDKLLKSLSKILGDISAEEGGLLFRYGGEEFAVILPDHRLDDAAKVSERLCQAVSDADFVGTECMPGNHITVSIGVSSYPDMTKNRNHIIAYADEALYKAKNLGRNRVEVYKSDLLSLIPDLADKPQFDIPGMQELVANLRDVDHYTYRHSERVMHYATSLAQRVGVSKTEMLQVQCAALLHDVGKCEIPRYILTKPSRMTKEEWELIKTHPVIGEEIVSPLVDNEMCLKMIRHHHERYDGGGYPDALAGEEIPFLARLLTVVDSFDAMTSSRPYQAKKSVQEAVEELKKCSGTQFDPFLAQEFVAIILDLKVKSLHVGA